MIKYYIKKIEHRMPIMPKHLLNVLQSRYLKLRFFVKNILKIEVDKILVGDMHGISSYNWYELTGDESRLEEKIVNSPYFEFFKAINENNLTEDNIKDFRYFKMASLCIEKFNQYCGCRNEKELISYLLKLREYFCDYKKEGSKSNLFIEVSQIKDTDFYEIVDGHHRIAMDAVLGNGCIYAFVVKSSFSGIQNKLFKVSMTNKKELYQPINKLTIEKWPTIRNCVDRFEMINEFLKKSESNLKNLSLVDIACSYGYFVKAFRDLGISAKGVEIDENAIEVGKISYGLDDVDYIQSSLQNYLRQAEVHDITCFFSILHHFGLNMDFGGGGLEIKELIKLLDVSTKKYLFLDSGQNHEYWFKDKLVSWNDEYIVDLILKNSNFKSFEKLGVDSDNIGKYSGNYSRSLFVFKK